MTGEDIRAMIELLVAIVLGGYGYFIKRTLDKLEKSDEQNSKEISSLKNSLNDFKQNVGKEFVRKEDYLQTTGEILKKLDKIFDMLYEMKGRERQ